MYLRTLRMVPAPVTDDKKARRARARGFIHVISFVDVARRARGDGDGDGASDDEDDDESARDDDDDRERASVRREWTRDGGDDAGTGPRARRRRDVDDDEDDDDDDDDDEREERRTNGDAGEIVLGEGWENGGWNHETKRRFRKVVSGLRARV